MLLGVCDVVVALIKMLPETGRISYPPVTLGREGNGWNLIALSIVSGTTSSGSWFGCAGVGDCSVSRLPPVCGVTLPPQQLVS